MSTHLFPAVEALARAAERTMFRAEECHARACDYIEERNRCRSIAASQHGAYAQAPWRAWASEAEEMALAWCMAGQVQMELSRGDRAKAVVAHREAWKARRNAAQYRRLAEEMTT